MVKILVYGTLRKGNPLSSYLNKSKFIKELWIKGFDMYSNGSYPYAVYGEGKILCELYEVDNVMTLNALDWVESEYNRTELKEGSLYVYNKKLSESFPQIPSGNWDDNLKIIQEQRRKYK